MDKQAGRSWLRLMQYAVGGFIAALAVYVLSVGPAAFVLAMTDHEPRWLWRAMLAFYYPLGLVWVRDWGRPGAWLEGYVLWWYELAG
jgi:hypothetical protein